MVEIVELELSIEEMMEMELSMDRLRELKCPQGVAFSPDANIMAVADLAMKQVHVYNRNMVHKYSFDTKQGLEPGTQSWPRNVIVSSNGICFLTDETQFVSQYDGVNGGYKGKWTAVSPQHKPSDTEDTSLRGLTMDTKGQLLVGEVKQKYISKHKENGIHVASFKVDIAPWSLAVTSQDEIILSDSSLSVHIVDNTGQYMHSIKHPTHARWSPAGVAYYEDIICVCNFTGKIIHCYSRSGKYLQDFPISIRGKPICLAFSPVSKNSW